LADAVIGVVLALATRDTIRAHGAIVADAATPFVVLGYGSLGGEELGFGSDLDVVFLYDTPADAQSAGPRPLDAPRWFARLAQKIVALLGTVTSAGRLFDVDVRLRPDGAKGLLVSSLSSFSEYQRDRAWTWEHQALVRARCVAGDVALCRAFDDARARILARRRNADTLVGDVAGMRARMRAELDRTEHSDGRILRFDLKQGEGGLVDLEFLLQYLVLRDAHVVPALLQPRDTPGLLAALCEAGSLPAGDCAALAEAHAVLLDVGLRCTLDRRARITPETDAIASARRVIAAAVRAIGLSLAPA
jgi:glutamate-ammonia-ligase adenylyltransferase